MSFPFKLLFAFGLLALVTPALSLHNAVILGSPSPNFYDAGLYLRTSWVSKGYEVYLNEDNDRVMAFLGNSWGLTTKAAFFGTISQDAPHDVKEVPGGFPYIRFNDIGQWDVTQGWAYLDEAAEDTLTIVVKNSTGADQDRLAATYFINGNSLNGRGVWINEEIGRYLAFNGAEWVIGDLEELSQLVATRASGFQGFVQTPDIWQQPFENYIVQFPVLSQCAVNYEGYSGFINCWNKCSAELEEGVVEASSDSYAYTYYYTEGGFTYFDSPEDQGRCSDGSTCTKTGGGFSCVCNRNDGLSGNGYICEEANECAEGTHNCAADAACTDTLGSFLCACNTGFGFGDVLGVDCPNDDECALQTHNCHAQATCTDTPGSFTCECGVGYETVDDGATCTDVVECGVSDTCADDAECLDADGSFTCECKPGFWGDGRECEDLNECLSETFDSCDANAMCANTAGSFTCTCNTGFEGDGATCTDIDECELQIGEFPAATHWRLANQGDCGWRPAVNELQMFADLDGEQELQYASLISSGSHVTTAQYEFELTTPEKAVDGEEYTKWRPNNGAPRAGEAWIGFQFEQPTVVRRVHSTGSLGWGQGGGFYWNGGVTLQYSQDGEEWLTAASSEAYSNSVQVELSDALSHRPFHQCAEDDSRVVCANSQGSYSCECVAGYERDIDTGTCSANADECASGTHNCDAEAICVDTHGSFTCQCNAGWLSADGGVTCTDDKECGVSDNCDANAACLDGEGSFTCACNHGYESVDGGVTCVSGIDECHPSALDLDISVLSPDGLSNPAGVVDGVVDSSLHKTHGSFGPADTCEIQRFVILDLGEYGEQAPRVAGLTFWHWHESPRQYCNQSVDFSATGEFAGEEVRAFQCGDFEECGDVSSEGRSVSLAAPQRFRYVRVGSSRNNLNRGVHILEVAVDVRGVDSCDANAACTNTIGSFSCECNAGFEGDGVTCHEQPLVLVLGRRSADKVPSMEQAGSNEMPVLGWLGGAVAGLMLAIVAVAVAVRRSSAAQGAARACVVLHAQQAELMEKSGMASSIISDENPAREQARSKVVSAGTPKGAANEASMRRRSSSVASLRTPKAGDAKC